MNKKEYKIKQKDINLLIKFVKEREITKILNQNTNEQTNNNNNTSK